MRKGYLFIWIVLIGILAGCGAQTPPIPPEMPVPLTGHAALHGDGDVFEADFSFDGEVSRFTLTKPERIGGVTIVCDADGAQMQSGNVVSDLPRQSDFYRLHETLRRLRSETFSGAQADEESGKPTRIPLGRDAFAVMSYPETITDHP